MIVLLNFQAAWTSHARGGPGKRKLSALGNATPGALVEGGGDEKMVGIVASALVAEGASRFQHQLANSTRAPARKRIAAV